MKIRLLKGWGKEKRGKIVEVTRNVAHGLMETGRGKMYKARKFVRARGFAKGRRDKMLRRTNKKIRTK